jgi:hypothetical protein
MNAKWTEDLKSLAWQLWRSPATPLSVVALGIAMLADNARTTMGADGMKTMKCLHHARVISTLKRSGGYQCEWIAAVRLPNLSNASSEAVFSWTATISSEGPALNVTVVLPGYEGYFSTAPSDGMACSRC